MSMYYDKNGDAIASGDIETESVYCLERTSLGMTGAAKVKFITMSVCESNHWTPMGGIQHVPRSVADKDICKLVLDSKRQAQRDQDERNELNFLSQQ